MKILIAEGSLIASLIHQEQLTILGYDFDLVVNGREAVDAACQSGLEYDLCLMDVNMPVMDGIEAVRVIRQHAAYHLPVILCSTTVEDESRCLAAGADGCLTKPISNEVLTAMLEEFTVKQVVLYLEADSLSVHRVGPANGTELKELRDLYQKGLSKFRVVDASVHFLAHRFAQNKLLDDLSCGHSVSTGLLDRTGRGEAVVQVRAPNISIRKLSVNPEQFGQLALKEDEEMKKFSKPIKW